eukprot:TCALIF_10061-PA protein Name:"Similar to Mlc2 Myosin regulatory light chain 2 (Drosophila melanogaster)" AED:0.01 eAED:0.01 QI:0/0.66/0.5/0.75/1/1/4/127/234
MGGSFFENKHLVQSILFIMGKGKGKGTGNSFTDDQMEVYKECFRLMDVDKDGVINKNDLRAAFDNVGRLMLDEELNAMLSDIGGQCTFENMIKCFDNKMAGGVNDADELVIQAIKCHDDEVIETVKGVTTVKHLILAEDFKHALMTFGDKLTQEEIDDIFGEFEFDDDGFILTKSVVDLFVAGGMDEKEEDKEDSKKKANGSHGDGDDGGAPDATPDVAGEGGKKKKKKKKAAK